MLAFSLALQDPVVESDRVQDEAAAAYDPTIRGRLLDAETGAPIAGAVCELWTEDFDRPARRVEAVLSRDDGTYEVHPVSNEECKVRMQAVGYRSTVVSTDGDDQFLFPSDEPLIVRVLDLEGAPIPGARIRSHQTCRHAPPAVEAVSGADGRAVLVDAPVHASVDYEVRASGFGALLPVFFEDLGHELCVFLPRRAPVRLRLLDAGDQPLANRRFRQQGPGLTAFYTDPTGRAVLESLFESREVSLEDCAKQLHLFGWPPLEGELVLKPEVQGGFEERETWPVLRLVGGGPYSTAHVQFGNDSETREFDTKVPGPLDVRVRPGEPVVVLTQGEEVRRARLEPWSGTRELDLSDRSLVIRPRAAPGEPVKLAFRVRTPEGEPLAVESRLGGSHEAEPIDEDASPDVVVYRVPRGARYVIGFSSEGYLPLSRTGRAGDSMLTPELVVLPRR